jgi:hypothetical protein
MAAQLAGEGYVVHAVDVNGLDLVADSAVIAEAVDRATAGVEVESLSIVAHSYGGLSSRSYLKTLDGSDTVDTYIAIGTPQYGSPGGCVQLPGFGFDGCPITPFIAELNAGDDTPGDTDYVSIRSDEELADGRLDGGQCRLAPGSTLTALPFPDTVQGVVTSRIDRLPAPEQLTLKVASVVGRSFTAPLIEDVYPIQEERTAQARYLETLANNRLVQREDVAYAFSNAITQDVAYQLMAPTQRRELHGSVARWYEAHFAEELSAVLDRLDR